MTTRPDETTFHSKYPLLSKVWNPPLTGTSSSSSWNYNDQLNQLSAHLRSFLGGRNISTMAEESIQQSYSFLSAQSITARDELINQIIVKFSSGFDLAGRAPNMAVALIRFVYKSPATSQWMVEAVYDTGTIEHCTFRSIKELLKITIKEDRLKK